MDLIEAQSLAQPEVKPPVNLLEMAVMHGAGIEVIERLVALQEHIAENKAIQEFNAALNRCQARMSVVSVDASNPTTHSRYATYAALDREVRPIYTAEGFALSFDQAWHDGDWAEILCYVSHTGGYTRTYRTFMPTDGKGPKGGDVMTHTHATAAGLSYGMRYLLRLIFNIAVGEDDRDGNNSGGFDNIMPEAEFQSYVQAIRAATDDEALKTIYLKAIRACPKGDTQTEQSFDKEKKARYWQLHPRKEEK